MSLNLATRQNQPRIIRSLGAQRALYSAAKLIFSIEASSAFAIPFISAIGLKLWPHWGFWPSVVSFLAWILSFFVLDPIRKKKCHQAAQVQEKIDEELLQLPASESNGTNDIDREEIIEIGTRHIERNGTKALKSWYPEVTDGLPAQVGRIVCQRANLWWDVDLRRRYVRICTILIVGIVGLWLLVGLIADLTMRNAFVNLIVPLFPLLYLLAAQVRTHKQLMIKKAACKSKCEDLWRAALRNPEDEDYLISESRRLQDCIYDLRKTPDLSWDWLYRLLRSRNENLMQLSAEELADEARKALARDSGNLGHAAPASPVQSA